mmetsp:Transcript_47928/g.145760  ORF Transcript_47928/g.145760 Transcript_47928/m.145760 type:complete len:212 (+) Transcript_47928:254-889(+)
MEIGFEFFSNPLYDAVLNCVIDCFHAKFSNHPLHFILIRLECCFGALCVDLCYCRNDFSEAVLTLIQVFVKRPRWALRESKMHVNVEFDRRVLFENCPDPFSVNRVVPFVHQSNHCTYVRQALREAHLQITTSGGARFDQDAPLVVAEKAHVHKHLAHGQPRRLKPTLQATRHGVQGVPPHPRYEVGRFSAIPRRQCIQEGAADLQVSWAQ